MVHLSCDAVSFGLMGFSIPFVYINRNEGNYYMMPVTIHRKGFAIHNALIYIQ